MNERNIGVIKGTLGVKAEFVVPFALITTEYGYSILTKECESLSAEEMLEAFEIAINLIRSDNATK